MKLFILLFPAFQHFWAHHLIDNSMFKIVLTFIPGMLTLSYPLITQSIGTLNTQYNSTHITNQFKKEKIHNIFLWNLRIAVLLTILGFTLSVKVFLIAFISIITLLFFFFLYLRLLLRYQSGQELLNIYLKKLNLDCNGLRQNPKFQETHHFSKLIFKFLSKLETYLINYWNGIVNKITKCKINRRKTRLLKYWHLIIDLYIYSIKNNNRHLETDIRELIIYKAFAFIKNCDQPDKPEVEFPPEMYNSIYDILSAFMKNKETDYYQNYDLLIAKIFYSESYSHFPKQYLHPNTLYIIWQNLILLVEHNQNDKIKEYWKWAHQYYSYELKLPETKYNDKWQQTEESINLQKYVSKHQDLFIQIHLLLGSYLLYKKNYATLKSIWFFTQSQPPSYYLFPDTPDKIIKYYLKYLNYEYINTDLLTYSFRALSFYGFNNEKVVPSVVREYLVLLFLRLYLLPQYYYGMDPLVNLPQTPENQNERNIWQDGLKNFSSILKRIKSDNRNILIELGLDDEIINENCLERKIKNPEQYIDSLIDKLNEEFKSNIEESPLDQQKILSLEKNSINSISLAYENLKRIDGDEVDKQNRDSVSYHMETIRGSSILLDREAFIKDPSVHNFNADSILGEIISENYYQHFAFKLSQQKKKLKLKVKNGHLFNAIEKLNPNPDEFSILNMGFNLTYIREYQNTEIYDSNGLEDARYKGIPIYNFTSIPHIGQKIYLIRNEFLPMIKHKDYKEIRDLPLDSIKYWESLRLIDDSLKIYCKISDLNFEIDQRASFKNQGNSDEELNNKLGIVVDFIGYCWFRKETEVIEISESNIFQEGGNINEINDIKPL